MSELSPLMQQYRQIKEKYKDAIVFFRVGDFYEMFFEDALTASKELELTLTGKDCGLPERAPMCGVPFHSYENYAARLIAKGYKVAICEQTEDPSKTKKLVRRDVIRVITPGTVMEQSMLDEGSNNFICSVYTQKNQTGMAFCDVSTGELFATLISEQDAESSVKDELLKFSPVSFSSAGKRCASKRLPRLSRTSFPHASICRTTRNSHLPTPAKRFRHISDGNCPSWGLTA